MKCRWLRGFWVTSLLCFALLFQASCSSQQQQGEEVVAGEEEGGEGQSEGEYAQANEGGNEGDGGENFAGNIEGGALEGGNNELLSGNNELAAGNAALEGNAAASGGDGDLTNIINEMNQQSAQANAVAPVDPALAAAPMAAAPAEALPAPVGGGVIAGLAGAPAGPGLPEMGSKLAYIVKKGDTLAKISAMILGDAQRFQELAQLSNIPDPSRIYPGDVIYYQLSSESLAFATDYENSSREEVTVQDGDTLATISERIYGSAKQWRSIWRQNGQIANPNDLAVGSLVFYVSKEQADQKLASKHESTKNTNSNKLATVKIADQEASENTETISVEVIEHGYDLTSSMGPVAVDMTINLVDA